MGLSSTAKSTTSAFTLKKLAPDVNANLLPRKIAIIAEMNHANQTASLTPYTITSASQAAARYGYMSPLHMAALKCLPTGGGGVPCTVTCFPVEEAASSAAEKLTIAVTGTATSNATHTVVVNGNRSIEGQTYNFSVVSGDTATTTKGKIRDAINNVLFSPVTAAIVSTTLSAEAKWYGVSGGDILIRIETNGNDAGITYAVSEATAGAGLPDIADALTAFGTTWYTDVILGWDLSETDYTDALNAFNGVPDEDNPTGRYIPQQFIPLVAYFGTKDNDPTSLTDAMPSECTVVPCVAPLSESMPVEIAASWCRAFTGVNQNDPTRSIINTQLTGVTLPVEGDIPAMQEYATRDAYVKLGCSTIIINQSNRWAAQDMVTTYHPEGEIPLHYAYPRDLSIYWNIKYNIALLENAFLIGKTLVTDNDPATGDNIMKPKLWVGIIKQLAESAAKLGWIADLEFALANITASIDSENPNRMNTLWKLKISGTAIISDFTVQSGFVTGS